MKSLSFFEAMTVISFLCGAICCGGDVEDGQSIIPKLIIAAGCFIVTAACVLIINRKTKTTED